ncbi:hypothetical protein [Pseudomonas paracarnis]|uniref:hypothetical protein n=1 Tax=Pseudomonas paracarnis TaxID=2750625 RepID=UPI002938D7AF|nr:hypothetical protein [Pseudomonas paracarnis]MDV3054434.1 hypothetical protein [Pseudomonas paracarnis]
MAATCAVMGLNDVFKRADHCWQRLIKAWGGGLYEGWGVAGVFVRQDAAGGVAEKLLSPGETSHQFITVCHSPKCRKARTVRAFLVGRGKLNCYYNLLILLLKKLFFIFMEYHLEYPFSE